MREGGISGVRGPSNSDHTQIPQGYCDQEDAIDRFQPLVALDPATSCVTIPGAIGERARLAGVLSPNERRHLPP